MDENFRWPGQDPVSPDAPQQRGIGGQGFPNTSPFDMFPEQGATPPYPKAEPPPMPQLFRGNFVKDVSLLGLQVLRGILGHPWSREAIQSFMEEASRTAFRPVHLPPWPEMPVAGTQVGGVSALTNIPAGTTVTLVSATIPRGCFSFFPWLGQDTQNDAAGAGGTDWAGLEWSIAFGPDSSNLLDVPGYRAFTAQLGQIEAPCRINVFAPAGVCVLRVTNTTVADIPNVRGRLNGWFWPVAVRMSSIHVNEHIKG